MAAQASQRSVAIVGRSLKNLEAAARDAPGHEGRGQAEPARHHHRADSYARHRAMPGMQRGSRGPQADGQRHAGGLRFFRGQRVAVVGGGNMGAALIGGLLASGAVDPLPLIAATVSLEEVAGVLGAGRQPGWGDAPKIDWVDPARKSLT